MGLEGTLLSGYVAQSGWLEEQCRLSSFFFFFSRWRNRESSTPRRLLDAMKPLCISRLETMVGCFSPLRCSNHQSPTSQLSSTAQSLNHRRRQLSSTSVSTSSVHFRRAAHRWNQVRRRIRKTRETSMATFGYFAHPVLIVWFFSF